MDSQRFSTIGALAFDPAAHPVYRRGDGTTWMKLSESHHAPAKDCGEYWDLAGATIPFDPDEFVHLLHHARERVA